MYVMYVKYVPRNQGGADGHYRFVRSFVKGVEELKYNYLSCKTNVREAKRATYLTYIKYIPLPRGESAGKSYVHSYVGLRTFSRYWFILTHLNSSDFLASTFLLIDSH